MSELEEAIAALERAVARLEAVPPPLDAPLPVPAPEEGRMAEIAEQLTARVDAALARIDKLLAEGG
ncbi:MAG TPA: hypothetical protein VHU15_12715 [Stellaceae bacterium]|jgi:exonuclease VII small subunit|nr:hypothetical protein [Stellaceae bacterium]